MADLNGENNSPSDLQGLQTRIIRLENSFLSLKKGIIYEFMPGVTKLTAVVAGLTERIDNLHGQSDDIEKLQEDLKMGLTEAFGHISGVAEEVKRLSEILNGFNGGSDDQTPPSAGDH
jgi:hypothetical protein